VGVDRRHAKSPHSGYFSVDYDIVCDAATTKVRELQDQIRQILQAEARSWLAQHTNTPLSHFFVRMDGRFSTWNCALPRDSVTTERETTTCWLTIDCGSQN
jgi:hypothetical protein